MFKQMKHQEEIIDEFPDACHLSISHCQECPNVTIKKELKNGIKKTTKQMR